MGSEMCIRDSRSPCNPQSAGRSGAGAVAILRRIPRQRRRRGVAWRGAEVLRSRGASRCFSLANAVRESKSMRGADLRRRVGEVGRICKKFVEICTVLPWVGIHASRSVRRYLLRAPVPGSLLRARSFLRPTRSFGSFPQRGVHLRGTPAPRLGEHGRRVAMGGCRPAFLPASLCAGPYTQGG